MVAFSELVARTWVSGKLYDDMLSAAVLLVFGIMYYEMLSLQSSFKPPFQDSLFYSGLE